MEKAWFVNEVQILFFSAPEEIKIDYKVDKHRDKDELWFYLIDWAPTFGKKGFMMNGLVFGILMKFIPIIFIFIILIIMIIIF